MAEIEVQLPSGARGRMRGLRGREFRMLADRRGARTGETLTNVLRDCWLETLDDGPYARFSWADAYTGDHVAGLIALRQASFPPPDHKYPFDTPCKHCGAKIRWEVDLADFPLVMIPAETAKKLKAGDNRFEVTFGTRRAVFRLLTNRDASTVARLKARAEGQTDLLVTLAVQIVAFDSTEHPDPMAVLGWLEELEAKELRDLMAAMHAVDFGVETGFDVSCRGCGADQEIDLPFTAAFFMPKKA